MDVKREIDLDHLEKYVAGDVALRDEILETFSDQLKSLGRQFHIDQTDGDWRDTAHAMKGAARGVGAWTIGALCEDAENLTGEASGKRERRAAALVSIRHQLERLLAEVSELRAAAV